VWNLCLPFEDGSTDQRAPAGASATKARLVTCDDGSSPGWPHRQPGGVPALPTGPHSGPFRRILVGEHGAAVTGVGGRRHMGRDLHRSAHAGRRRGRPRLGRRRRLHGELATKIHLVADGRCHALAFPTDRRRPRPGPRGSQESLSAICATECRVPLGTAHQDPDQTRTNSVSQSATLPASPHSPGQHSRFQDPGFACTVAHNSRPNSGTRTNPPLPCCGRHRGPSSTSMVRALMPMPRTMVSHHIRL
jgi:hypothetical protein